MPTGGQGNFAGTGGYSSGSTVAGNAGGYGNPSSPTGGTGGQTQNSFNSGNWGGSFSGMGYANDRANQAAYNAAKAAIGTNNAGSGGSTSSGTISKVYKIVVDPITGKKKKVAVTNPIVNPPVVDPLNPFPPVPGEFNPPIPQPRPVHATNWRGGDMYGGNIYSNAPYGGWTEHVDFGKDPSRVDTPGKDPGRLNPDSGQGTGPGGAFGGQDTPGGDMRSMSMMAATDQPLVSPGPIGPGGQPMGNRPPPFQWGARDLALRHGLEQMMRHRQQMARRPQYGRNEHVQRILRAAARRGRA